MCLQLLSTYRLSSYTLLLVPTTPGSHQHLLHCAPHLPSSRRVAFLPFARQAFGYNNAWFMDDQQYSGSVLVSAGRLFHDRCLWIF